ncbi:MAG: sigma-70 family RNA polymerase sigma factor [Candidatus Ratteibacteria bacterium]
MEYIELIEKINEGLIKICKKLEKECYIFDYEDLLQEIYIYLWEEWIKGNLNSKSHSYILRGCYLYLKNFIRKNEKNNKISFEIPFENNDIYLKHTEYQIDKILKILDEREEKILNLILEGYTYREIGKTLGISHIMVLKILKKIRDKIKPYKHLIFK